ncbi:MAG: hypothetical protein AB7O04_13995 [Hyphomonadaceae bacterium]
MKPLLIFLCALAAVAPGYADAQDASIAQRVATEIQNVLPGALVAVPDPNGLDITFGGQTRSVGIGSVHMACAQGVPNCNAAIHTYAQRAASYMLETAPVLPDQLRIVVRTRSYLDGMAVQMGSTDGFVAEPLAGDLVSVCYRDLPRGRRPISPRDLVTLQLDQTTALSMCKTNSNRSLAPLASLWNELPEQGIGVIRNGDDVTGYLSATENWQALAEQLGGLIVAVPSIDALLYARGSNVIDADAIATLAREIHAQAAVPVSPQVFRWTDRGWVVEGQALLNFP